MLRVENPEKQESEPRRAEYGNLQERDKRVRALAEMLWDADDRCAADERSLRQGQRFP
jgi:hypothetical protein